MRVDVVVKDSKKDGIGLGLIALCLVLFGIAYVLGSPDVASAFPRSVERGLTNFRAEADKIVDGAATSLGDVFRMVSGR
ncbi:MAG: hypothetical protein ACRCTI_07055 [Beijerinckiaceae bacterium]